MIPIGTWRTSLEVLVVCGAFAACAGALPTTPGPLGTATIQTAKHAELGQEFQLRNTESTAIGPDGLTLRFDRVTRDERCPIGHRCTVEGDAVVEVTLRQAGNEAVTVDLHTDPSLRTEARYLHYTVRLVRLEPRPVGEQHVPLPEYTATFVVLAAQAPVS